MPTDFNQLKEELIIKAKAKSACADQYKRAANSKTEQELLQVIYDNIVWCISAEIISNEYFSRFTPEVFLNSGLANTGKENIGFINSGNRNSGNRNSGDSNSGDSNSGYSNSGDSNSGNSNSGNWNSGDSNSGNRNSGDSNSGDSNSGNWNSGDRNSGDSNSGYRNSGAFCTDANPPLILFNKVSKMTVKEWENHPACQLMYSIDPTILVPMSIMTDEEKKAHPKYETTEGYLKTITMKEAWSNFWHNLNDDKKKLFTDLENFDAIVFEKITGVKL